MDTSANIITTMGIIANEVYASNKQTYFEDLYENGEKIEQSLEANGTTYKVIDHTPADNEGFNALLLKDESTGEYVIAFRGTQETFDIVEDGINGILVPQKNIEELANAIEKLIHDSELRTRMGDEGRLRYEKQFTLETFEKKLVSILNK